MRYVLVLLALCGIIVSSLALRVHYHEGNEVCSINEHWDCGVVNHSDFAVMYGVPVAAIGIAGYLALAILAFLRHRAMFLIATIAGMAFALRLTWIEKHVLEVWCLYCVISQCIIAIMLLLGIAWWFSRFRADTPTDAPTAA